MEGNNLLNIEQLTEIATEFGTPTYVYYADKITQQYQQLKSAFAKTDARFFYACKALTNINVLKHIKNIGCNIDCSSINEVKLALMAGFEPQNILYTSNGIAFTEIEEAQSLGVHINIDSLSNLAKFGQRFGHSYPVGIRLRPNIMAGGNIKISTGHSNSKFGIPVEQIDEVLKTVKENNIFIQGLHLHTGSEIKDVNIFIEGMEVLFNILPKFPELEFIDLGGGFKVAYKEGDHETDMELLGVKVTEAFHLLDQQYGRPLQVWFEPGKYLVSECGFLIVQATVLKETHAATFVSVNSGFNHLIRPMFYDSYHHITNISNPNGIRKNYTVTGNICETDTFATDRTLNEVREGDLLVFHNAGAYAFEMSSNYNSRFKPAEVLIDNNLAKLIRKRDELNDLLKNVVMN
jgi:diaminopimelate decarboxylase